MARIAGVDLPREKRVEAALPYIYGIGWSLSRKILRETGINPDTRVRDLSEDEVATLLDRFCSKAQRSGLKPFVTLAKTIRRHKAGILSAIRLGINNARHEGLNRRVRLVINRAYGFHSARAALALVMLTLGPIEHVLPHERVPKADP